MKEINLIDILSNIPNLEITCPKCDESFAPRSARLFDIRQPYPSKILQAFHQKKAQIAYKLKSIERQKNKWSGKLKILKEKELKLTHRKIKRPKIVRVTTKHINIGQIIEKILIASPKYRYNIADCRSVFDPIDYMAFNGYSNRGAVDSISIIEVKSGDANLQKVQKQIKSTVESGKFGMRTY